MEAVNLVNESTWCPFMFDINIITNFESMIELPCEPTDLIQSSSEKSRERVKTKTLTNYEFNTINLLAALK